MTGRRPGPGRALPALLLVLVAACGREPSGPPPAAEASPGAPVVLISIDTLRSDRLPAYGYRGVDTPALDRLRADSILFERAYTPIPLTFPSHSSMLTGLLPPEHGVRDNLGYRLDAGRLPYLPRLLRERGYATGGAVSSFVLQGASGLAEGFDFYDDRIGFVGSRIETASVERPGDETLERALGWLRCVADRPFFLFFHLFEPHTPYTAPEPFASRYRSPYDAEVAAADAVVGRLLANLRELGAYDRSLIVLTSDHGEGLDDHGYRWHGPLLYREALQVPLLVKLPGGRRAGATAAAPAQLSDLAPTVLELVGGEAHEAFSGEPLLAPDGAEPSSRRLYGETFYSRVHFGWSELFSVIEWPFHYIHGPDPELFHLERDPGETVNLVRRERAVARELARELDRYDRTLAEPLETDDATRRRLAALGYVGATATAGDDEGPRPDPKSRLHVLEDLRAAHEAAAEGRSARAIRLFEAVLAEEPGLIDAWEGLGNELLRSGRAEEALAAYRRAVDLTGGAPAVTLAAANALIRLGRLEEARGHAELVAASVDAAHDVLAQIALREGDLDSAERHVARAVETRAGQIDPLVTQAELRLRQERYREAVEITRQVERELATSRAGGPPRGLFQVRGTAWAKLGEAAEAAEAFRREIGLFPDAVNAYTQLAFVYAVEGRSAEAGATLRQLVESNPSPAAYAAAVRTLREMGDARSAGAVLGRALARWPESAELSRLAGS